MKTVAPLLALLLSACASTPRADTAANPPMRPGGPDWDAVDRSTQRTKEREENRPRLVETARSQEQGFRTMSDDDYAAALDAARADLRKANPKISDGDLEQQAAQRADHAKWQYEHSPYSSASSSYELQRP